MRTIFVTISRGSLIRNFFHTGIITHLLKQGIRVVVLTPFHDRSELFEEFAHSNLLFEPLLVSPKERRKRLMRELLRGAVFNSTVHVRYKYRMTTSGIPSKWLYIPRLILFAPLRFIPGFRRFIRFVDICIDPQREHDYLFEKYKPSVAFSTTPHENSDIGVLKSAKRFGVKTITMPKSWDNLSKILFNVKTDLILVWSLFMRRQVRTFQGYRDNEIIVTGAPQFDYYADVTHLISREEFARRHNLDPDKKIILYGSAGATFCHEERYLKLLRRFIEEGKLTDVQVLIRPHIGYVGDVDRFKEFAAAPCFSVDTTEKQDTRFKDNWDPTEYHLNNLFNSLHHSVVCINAVSTLTLDAAVCGIPSINVKFDIGPTDIHMSTKRLYKEDYVRALIATGGTWLVESGAEFLDALQEILSHGTRRKEKELKTIVEEFAYTTDGKASERVAHAVAKALEEV